MCKFSTKSPPAHNPPIPHWPRPLQSRPSNPAWTRARPRAGESRSRAGVGAKAGRPRGPSAPRLVSLPHTRLELAMTEPDTAAAAGRPLRRKSASMRRPDAPATASRPKCSSSSGCAPSCCTPSTPNRRRRPSPFRVPGSSPPTSCTAGMALTRPVSARCSGCRRKETTAYAQKNASILRAIPALRPVSAPVERPPGPRLTYPPAGTSCTVRAPFERGAPFAGAGRAPSFPR